MVATLAMRSRLRPDWNTALIGYEPAAELLDSAICDRLPPSMLTSTEGDAMSRNRPFHPVPRGGIDPIRSREDALAVLTLGAPYGHDTVIERWAA